MKKNQQERSAEAVTSQSLADTVPLVHPDHLNILTSSVAAVILISSPCPLQPMQ